jgi:hypothetical protein
MRSLLVLDVLLQSSNSLRHHLSRSSLVIVYSQHSHSIFLRPKVFNHPFVLRDSLSFVRMLDKLNVPSDDSLRFATYDVTALYPSIDLERGLQSLTH